MAANCKAASNQKQIQYVKRNAPITKSRFNKTIDAVDAKLKVVTDWFSDKVFTK